MTDYQSPEAWPKEGKTKIHIENTKNISTRKNEQRLFWLMVSTKSIKNLKENPLKNKEKEGKNW